MSWFQRLLDRNTETAARTREELREFRKEIMAEVDDLKAGVAQLETDLATNKQLLTDILAKLTAAPGGLSAADTEALANQIKADAAGLEADDSAAKASAGV